MTMSNQRSLEAHKVNDIERLESIDVSQKIKFKCGDKGDKNSMFFHSVLKKASTT